MSEVKHCTVRLKASLAEMHTTFYDSDFKPALSLTAAWPRLASKNFAEILPRFCRDSYQNMHRMRRITTSF
jgi:hypothetical protein